VSFAKSFLVLAVVLLALLAVIGMLVTTDRFDDTPRMTSSTENAIYRDSSLPIDERVADLLARMTLEEKIGQMALVEKDSIKNSSDISNYYLGGLLSGAGAKPAVNTAEGWKVMIDAYQAEARQTRLGIPLLYGVDAIHGHAHVPGATVFPHAIGLGATRNPELVKAIAQATAAQLRATSVNWSFSPNLDLPQDIRWGRVYEAFSDDPALVSELGRVYIEGLQQASSASSSRIEVLATPKHFLGLGGMQWNTSLNKNFKIDQGVTPADETVLRSVYLPPFAEAVDAGALSIMVGLNTWGDTRMVRQKVLLTDLLKDELGFIGFLVSDWYGVHEGRRFTFLATVQAVNAGIDMLMLPFDYHTFAQHMKSANRLGLISDERINDAVGRILYAKFALGLFDEQEIPGQNTNVANPSYQALARETVAASLVLLKNDQTLLPLRTDTPHIRVVGSAAHNIGRQMGAWTIEWQGIDGNWPVGATSILDGIKARVSQNTIIEYDRLGNFTATDTKVPVGIAVVGEQPYAEGWGDKAYPTLSAEDVQAIQKLNMLADRVVVVIVSGRPLLIADELNLIDALVVAWLPGSEGGGVADGLFGRTQLSGTLPIPWPSHAEQLPITSDGLTANGTSVLFPRYYRHQP
jgi:beta-glucosidase